MLYTFSSNNPTSNHVDHVSAQPRQRKAEGRTGSGVVLAGQHIRDGDPDRAPGDVEVLGEDDYAMRSVSAPFDG